MFFVPRKFNFISALVLLSWSYSQSALSQDCFDVANKGLVLSQAKKLIQETDSGLPRSIQGINLLDGKRLEISFDQSAKATVVLFLSTRCPCSASHHSALESLYTEFANKGFQFIGVHSNANEGYDEARSFFSTLKLPFPIIQDQDSKIADQFEAFKTPHAFALSPTLKVLFQGGVDNSRMSHRATRHYLKNALTQIDQGLPIKEPFVRVLGCQIQRPD